MIWLLATAFLSLGLVNLDFSRGWWRGQLRRLAIACGNTSGGKSA